MSTRTLAIPGTEYDQFCLSYRTTLQIIHWRNDAEGSVTVLFKRTAAELAFFGLTIVSVVETIARLFFAVVAAIYGDFDTVNSHLKGSLISTINFILSPAHLISNLFNTRMSDQIM